MLGEYVVVDVSCGMDGYLKIIDFGLAVLVAPNGIEILGKMCFSIGDLESKVGSEDLISGRLGLSFVHEEFTVWLFGFKVIINVGLLPGL